MALITGRTVWFYEDTGILRHGIVQRASALGRLIVLITDGSDDLRQIGLEPNIPVYFSEEQAHWQKQKEEGRMSTNDTLLNLYDMSKFADQAEADADMPTAGL